jgi:hypothetical protein
VFRRQEEARGGRIVLHDATRRHGTEPLADISLVQACSIRNLLARAWPLRGRLEQTGPVADIDHQRQHAAGVVAEQCPSELLHPLPIRRFHDTLLLPARLSLA